MKDQEEHDVFSEEPVTIWQILFGKAVFISTLIIFFKSKNDILFAITTSGKSKNIIEVLKFAKRKKIYSFGLLGNDGGYAKKYCKNFIIVPSKITARIQEAHILLGHTLFERIEDLILSE